MHCIPGGDRRISTINSTPWKINMEPTTHPWKERKMIFQTSITMFHVNLQGCTMSLFVVRTPETSLSWRLSMWTVFCSCHQHSLGWPRPVKLVKQSQNTHKLKGMDIDLQFMSESKISYSKVMFHCHGSLSSSVFFFQDCSKWGEPGINGWVVRSDSTAGRGQLPPL